jgi:hypothetical protein
MEISPMQGSPLGETAAVKGMLARVKCFFVSRTQRFFVFALLYLIITFVATSFLLCVLDLHFVASRFRRLRSS